MREIFFVTLLQVIIDRENRYGRPLFVRVECPVGIITYVKRDVSALTGKPWVCRLVVVGTVSELEKQRSLREHNRDARRVAGGGALV